MLEKAIKFGKALDKDDFETAQNLLAPECTYAIGKETLHGPKAICNSYEQNMLEGRKKLDRLDWGESFVQPISDLDYIVNFTDYLTHKGQKHVHRCQQKLSFNQQGQISHIKHIDNPKEQAALDAFYVKVGIKHPFTIGPLDHVAILVKDMEISIEWYQSVLGLKRYDVEAWGPFPVFMLGGTTGVAIFPVDGENNSNKSSDAIKIDHFAFQLSQDNFEKAKLHYEALEISYTFKDHKHFHSIYTKDPDGHTVELTTLITADFYSV